MYYNRCMDQLATLFNENKNIEDRSSCPDRQNELKDCLEHILQSFSVSPGNEKKINVTSKHLESLMQWIVLLSRGSQWTLAHTAWTCFTLLIDSVDQQIIEKSAEPLCDILLEGLMFFISIYDHLPPPTEPLQFAFFVKDICIFFLSLCDKAVVYDEKATAFLSWLLRNKFGKRNVNKKTKRFETPYWIFTRFLFRFFTVSFPLSYGLLPEFPCYQQDFFGQYTIHTARCAAETLSMVCLLITNHFSNKLVIPYNTLATDIIFKKDILRLFDSIVHCPDGLLQSLLVEHLSRCVEIDTNLWIQLKELRNLENTPLQSVNPEKFIETFQDALKHWNKHDNRMGFLANTPVSINITDTFLTTPSTKEYSGFMEINEFATIFETRSTETPMFVEIPYWACEKPIKLSPLVKQNTNTERTGYVTIELSKTALRWVSKNWVGYDCDLEDEENYPRGNEVLIKLSITEPFILNVSSYFTHLSKKNHLQFRKPRCVEATPRSDSLARHDANGLQLDLTQEGNQSSDNSATSTYDVVETKPGSCMTIAGCTHESPLERVVCDPVSINTCVLAPTESLEHMVHRDSPRFNECGNGIDPQSALECNLASTRITRYDILMHCSTNEDMEPWRSDDTLPNLSQSIYTILYAHTLRHPHEFLSQASTVSSIRENRVVKKVINCLGELPYNEYYGAVDNTLVSSEVTPIDTVAASLLEHQNKLNNKEDRLRNKNRKSDVEFQSVCEEEVRNSDHPRSTTKHFGVRCAIRSSKRRKISKKDKGMENGIRHTVVGHDLRKKSLTRSPLVAPCVRSIESEWIDINASSIRDTPSSEGLHTPSRNLFGLTLQSHQRLAAPKKSTIRRYNHSSQWANDRNFWTGNDYSFSAYRSRLCTVWAMRHLHHVYNALQTPRRRNVYRSCYCEKRPDDIWLPLDRYSAFFDALLYQALTYTKRLLNLCSPRRPTCHYVHWAFNGSPEITPYSKKIRKFKRAKYTVE